jgi:predicted transcriptional regulator
MAKKKDLVTTTFRIERSILKEMERIADREDRSRAQLINLVLRDWLKTQNIGKAA